MPSTLRRAQGKPYRLTGEHFYKFFQCPHWIWYDLYGDQQKMGATPPLMDMIQRDGLQHERKIIEARHVEKKFEEVKPELFKDLDEAFVATLELMRQGKNIYHGVLMSEHWVGIPDLLEARPVEKGMKSHLGDHYYVVYDIKSGVDLKDEYKFQLTFYSLILERIQGVLPREASIINGAGEEQSFIVDEFLDYFHFTRERIERILEGEKPPPFLKSSCKVSPWYTLCLEETKGCDDVSLVHRLSQADQHRLYDLGITTVNDLASANLDDLRAKLEDWPFDKVLRFHNQASVLTTGQPMILKRPEFSAAETEVYFDVESDPTEAIDYLFGILVKRKQKIEYRSFFAKDKLDEKRMWREFLDFVDGLEDPFVIYHYSYYERQVFDRFAREYGISQVLDEKFKTRARDLQKMVTESAVLPLYFYSLKDVARYLGFQWQSPGAGGAESVVWYNEWLKQKKAPDASVGASTLDKIFRYNEDDVRATLFVKEWLERQKPKTVREKLE